MGKGFSKKPYSRIGDTERLLFVCVSGLVFSFLIALVVILNYKQASASKINTPEVVAAQNIAPPPLGNVKLLAPERMIVAGTKLSDVKFKEVYWPRNTVPEGAIRDASEVQNFYAKANLEPNVPIQRTQLSDQVIIASLPLTPGNRAVSIAVDDTSGLEGHARPGQRVDISLTYYVAGALTSKFIVQNARVLSYGGDTRPEEGGVAGSPVKIAQTITLDVSPQDALKIQTARQLGKLSLVLRAQGDNRTASVTQISAKEIGGGEDLSKKNEKRCTKGRVRIASGKEYMVDCDGTINQLEEPAPSH